MYMGWENSAKERANVQRMGKGPVNQEKPDLRTGVRRQMRVAFVFEQLPPPLIHARIQRPVFSGSSETAAE
jgi:hypothetical protein